MKNKIAVIGTINKDTIHLSNGKISEGYGGILYNILAIEEAPVPKMEIYPVVNIGRDCARDIYRILDPILSIQYSAVYLVDAPNNHCHLFYDSNDDKREILEGGVPPLRFRDLIPALGCDLVLVNFISGNDIESKALDKFRSAYDGPIYMDIHSLTLGKKDDGTRFLKEPHDWNRYVAAADYLQMNGLEFELISGKKPIISNLKSFYGSFDLKALIVTAGKDGASMIHGSIDNIQSQTVKPNFDIKMVDPTGRGDIFGGVFCANLIEGRSLLQCLRNANDMASNKIIFSVLRKNKSNSSN